MWDNMHHRADYFYMPKSVYNILAGKAKGKRPLGRNRRRWEDNMKIDLKEIRMESVDRINMAQESDQ
jgi:hypothetical protein